MPELPEVETTRRGIADILTGQAIETVTVRDPRLRWPVPDHLQQTLQGQRVRSVERRAKYLLIGFEHGTLIVHLGMSGTLRVVTAARAVEKHDHVDLALEDGRILRYRDPRRFGCILWHEQATAMHPLLASLGPEPLSDTFNADYLKLQLARRQAAIKLVIMDQHVVVGVGNIYASEALFRARIDPQKPAATLKKREITALVDAIKATLADAIAAGGTTLRDYVDSSGNTGYFQLQTYAYGRTGEPCRVCNSPIVEIRQGQRATFFCPNCQK